MKFEAAMIKFAHPYGPTPPILRDVGWLIVASQTVYISVWDPLGINEKPRHPGQSMLNKSRNLN